MLIKLIYRYGVDTTTLLAWRMRMMGTTFTSAGAWDALGSRGAHVGWPFLTLIGAVCLAALFFG